MAELKLYYVPTIQTLVYTENNYNLKLENLPMNRFAAQIYKSSNNTLDFSVRDRDRQPINLLDKTLTAYLTNVTSGELVLSKELEKLDETNGFARLNLSVSEINDWDIGYYKYAIVVQEENGREGLAYVNQVSDATGSFEVFDDAIPSAQTATEISIFTEQTIEFDTTVYISSAAASNCTNLHSFAWYLTNFLGTITIEATLDETIQSDDEGVWTTVYTTTFTNEVGTGIVHTNLNGLYTFFRFVYEEGEFNTGTVDKVLYK